MRYLIQRLLWAGPVLWLISATAFGLLRLAPGGPFDRERAPASPGVEQALRERYHLDEPLGVQYLRYLGFWWERGPEGAWRRVPGGLIVGDLGPSLRYRDHPVNDIVGQALPVSLTLGILAFLVAVGLGVPLGIWAAWRGSRLSGQLANGTALLAIGIPALVSGPLLVWIFSLGLGWFPVGLWGSARHAVLPTLALGLYFAGRIARLMREGMLGVLSMECIRAARARGIAEGALCWRHAFPMAVLPVVSYSGPLLADLLTGSFVAENLFQIPGLGVVLVNGTLSRDYPLVLGIVILYAVVLLILNLGVDLLSAILDPRIRHE